MSNRTNRCYSRTLILAVAVVLLGTGMALGQTCPPGAPPVGGTHTTGLPTTKTCPPQALPGTSYQCTFTVTNADLNHCVQNLTFVDTAPPGENPTNVQCLQGGNPVTLLAWAGEPNNLDECTGTITVTAPFNCTETNQSFTDRIDASGTDVGNNDIFTGLPSAGQASGTVVVPPLVCPAAPECNTGSCSTEVGCVVTPVADSTPCTDSDGNLCTTAGCEAGACVQAHTTTTCTPDNNECTSDPACNPATGTCEHPAVADSTPCTDSDGNLCTTAGCEAGACVQAHTTTTCTPDNNECTDDPACNPATGTCEHPAVADSTPCTDSDADVCTTAGCEAGACVQAHVTDPNCNVTEICRTPGFWGTHAGTEKTNSSDITGTLLTAFSDANGGPLSICGVEIADSADAMNAICASPKGNSLIQLARQLTSTALNCIITNATEDAVCTAATGDVCAGVSIQGIFEACNTACEAGFTSPQSGEFEGLSCISALDCFNNGGVLDESGECVCEFGADEETGECLNSCHSQPLSCGDFQPAAGSPRACTAARKDCTSIFGPIPGCTP